MKREYDFSKAKRGPVIPVAKGKTTIALQLDEEIVNWFRDQVEKAEGGDYRDLMNDALRQYMMRANEAKEETLRRVVSDEIGRAG
jgi:uncharacterized protein (DUF4415 family)